MLEINGPQRLNLAIFHTWLIYHVWCCYVFDLSFCYASKHFDLPTVEFDVVSHEMSQ